MDTERTDIDAPADECRDEAEQHKKAAARATDPGTKKRQKKLADDNLREANEIENDLA